MKILVTGSEGFIGKNLCLALSEQRHEIISFVRTTSLNEIENLVNKADAIIHLAGENRPKKPEDFETVNFGLTSLLCEVMRKVKKHIPIIFASSIQAELSNPYGLSKRSAENILRRLYNDLHIPVGIYRLPNVFGKWCSPNYNSVVATFCHNIANNIPIKINDPNSALQLVHIDVVVKSFIQFIHNPIVNTKLLCNVKPVYKITLGELVKKIEQFKLISNTLQIAQVGNGLTKALYSTFVSYLPKSSFNYCLPKYSDDRGEFVEMIRTKNSGQVSYFTAKPGITRGSHYHHIKTEKFLVVRGKAKFKFKHIISGETYELIIQGGEPEVVDSVPGWAHDITNIGKDELIVMLWSNENFNPDKPDTFFYPID